MNNNTVDALALWREMENFGKTIAEMVNDGKIGYGLPKQLFAAKNREEFMRELASHFVEAAKKYPSIIDTARAITALPEVSEPGNEYTFGYALALARFHYNANKNQQR